MMEVLRNASYWELLRRRAMTSVMSHAFLMLATRSTSTDPASRSGANVELGKRSTAAAKAPTYARTGETPYASQSIQSTSDGPRAPTNTRLQMTIEAAAPATAFKAMSAVCSSRGCDGTRTMRLMNKMLVK